MITVRECDDLEEYRLVWERLWPRQCIFDLWDVRKCFADAFNRQTRLLLAEKEGKQVGLLPLSWIEENVCFGFFPGETWMGTTWLEQNKIPSLDSTVRESLLRAIDGKAYLRYMEAGHITGNAFNYETDEIKYIFHPSRYSYEFDNYLDSFSRKSRKGLAAEEARLKAYGISFRRGHLPDLDSMFRMNCENFGEQSYFHDSRFAESFERLVRFLRDNNLLTITTVLLGDKVAAVDLGSIYKGVHTVLAGGSNPEFKGIAKIINFHHMKQACRERLKAVDFLCGDFGWKERFHLTGYPLYKLSLLPEAAMEHPVKYGEGKQSIVS